MDSKYKVGQIVEQNEKGYPPYNHCEIKITDLSYSTVVVRLGYTFQNVDKTEYNVHIPYEHLK